MTGKLALTVSPNNKTGMIAEHRQALCRGVLPHLQMAGNARQSPQDHTHSTQENERENREDFWFRLR